MAANILNALANIIENSHIDIKPFHKSENRVSNLGEALENYIKDVFADTIFKSDKERLLSQEKVFSYTGNQNNPPDIIIRNGDAIEVKKIESKTSVLALNSSYPKAKLFSSSKMITKACRECENWSQKDILYAVGVVPKEKGAEGKKLTNLLFIYGEDYAASASTYEKITNVISLGIKTISNVELAETNEIARVNRVDPLGITYLRIRGMWGIENPAKVFNYIYTFPENKAFSLMALISDEKYNSFPIFDKIRLEKLLDSVNFSIKDVKIKTPDNPSQLKNAKLITFDID